MSCVSRVLKQEKNHSIFALKFADFSASHSPPLRGYFWFACGALGEKCLLLCKKVARLRLLRPKYLQHGYLPPHYRESFAVTFGSHAKNANPCPRGRKGIFAFELSRGGKIRKVLL
jgi:hypothetical protein